jgi:hypothetical protein
MAFTVRSASNTLRPFQRDENSSQQRCRCSLLALASSPPARGSAGGSGQRANAQKRRDHAYRDKESHEPTDDERCNEDHDET